MITRDTRLCAACKAILPDPPAPQVCPKCGAVAIPHHSDWDPRLKYFQAAAFFSRHAIGNGRTEQLAWEDSLRALIAGAGGKSPNPFGIRFDAPAMDCYPIALTLALHWRATGALIVPDLIDAIGRSAGLIAAGFPSQRTA